MALTIAGLLSSDAIRSRRRWLLLVAGVSIIAMAFFFASTTRHRHDSHSVEPPFAVHFDDVQPPAADFHFDDAPEPARPPFKFDPAVKEYVKPAGFKLIGLVFYGRRNRVEMLRCFLERNLVDNGGWLDEIHWVLNTGKKDDLAYLDEILASSPRYKKIVLEDVGFIGYGYAWTHLERSTMYMKIDDDVVWFADDAIPRVVTMKIEHPEYLLVSANIINSPLMGWLHYHMGALHPYLPEFDVYDQPPPKLLDLAKTPRKSWKYTDYPNWVGPPDWYFDLDQDPPYLGHPWLRLPNDSDIHRTPVADIEYKTWGTGLHSWAIAAQQHYSFLENLADNRLDRYKFGKAWVTDYRRLSINFMTVWSDDVLDNLPMDTVDEEWLTVNLPKKLGKSVAVESDALAVHFTFGTQGKVDKTDLLARYRDYAMEHACARR